MSRRTRGRLLSHAASDPEIKAIQQAIGSRPAKPYPKIKEKRLINGKWTRDWSDPVVVVPQPNLAAQMMAETPPHVPDPMYEEQLTPVQQRMRELAVKLKEKKDDAAL